jgi:zinc protease
VIGGVKRLRGQADDSAPTLSFEAPLPFDAEVDTGTLSNGLTYFIRQNDVPSGHAELRLVVNAGSVFEEERQRGLAHAVEHMAFRGTRRFPGARIVDYLQSIGMRSGDDVNAFTSFDDTRFQLRVPTKRAGAIDTAFAILADWAHDVSFDSTDARKEAGVVFEEWRTNLGATDRVETLRDSVLLRGSRYANRFPIGDTLVLRRFDLGEMRRFYRSWYRPELMAVIAVGDFDPAVVRRLIEKEFGAIPASAPRITRPNVPPPSVSPAHASVFEDDELRTNRVAIWYPRARSRPRSFGEYQSLFVESLALSVLEQRLTRLADLPDAPLIAANARRRDLTRSVRAFGLTATPIDGESLSAIRVLAEEVNRIRRFGPLESELVRQKNLMIKDRRASEAFAESSEEMVDALERHFLTGRPVLGDSLELEVTKQLLATIDTGTVRRFFDRFNLDSGATIVAMGRSIATERLTTQALMAAAREGETRVADSYHDADDSLPTLHDSLESGTITSERILKDPDVFDWRLSNGMRVIVKPTDLGEEVIMHALSFGGASLVDSLDYPSAYLSDAIVTATGVGPLTGLQLANIVDRSSITLTATVTDDWLSVNGRSNTADMGALFSLTHLYLTAPRSDSVAFGRYRARARTLLRNRDADPALVFNDSVRAALQPKSHRAHPGTAEFVNSSDLRRAVEFWRARTANASNFTVVIVGRFTLEGLRPFVERYLASLPSGAREMARDFPRTFADRAVEHSYLRGTAPAARTQIVFSGGVTLTPQVDARIRYLRDVLAFVLVARIRDSLGGTYGVSVDLDVRHAANSNYDLRVDFTADPSRVDSLASRAIAEVQRICTDGPDGTAFKKIVAAAREELSSSAENNEYWEDELSWHATLGWPLESITQHAETLDKLTREDVRDDCRRFVDPTRYTRITMRPRVSAQSRALAARSPSHLLVNR